MKVTQLISIKFYLSIHKGGHSSGWQSRRPGSAQAPPRRQRGARSAQAVSTWQTGVPVDAPRRSLLDARPRWRRDAGAPALLCTALRCVQEVSAAARWLWGRRTAASPPESHHLLPLLADRLLSGPAHRHRELRDLQGRPAGAALSRALHAAAVTYHGVYESTRIAIPQLTSLQ